MRIKWKPLLLSIAFSLAVGGLSGFLVRNDFARYQDLHQPAFSPPGWVFPLVWTILYILMGISAYIISRTRNSMREPALFLYVVQLIVNFLWSPLFFGAGWYLFAFFWLLFLIYLAAAMVYDFYKIQPLAAYLQIPYLLWLVFAAYLNLGIWMLNRL